MKITLKQAVVAASLFQYTAASVTMHKLIKQIPGNKILKSIGANAIDGVIAYPYMKELQEIMLSEDSMWDASIEIPGPKNIVKKISSMMSGIVDKQSEKSSDEDLQFLDDEDDSNNLDEASNEEPQSDTDDNYCSVSFFVENTDHGEELSFIRICSPGKTISVYNDKTLNDDTGVDPDATVNGIWEWLRYIAPNNINYSYILNTYQELNEKYDRKRHFAVLGSDALEDGREIYTIGVYRIKKVQIINTTTGERKKIKLNENKVRLINNLVLRNGSLKPYEIIGEDEEDESTDEPATVDEEVTDDTSNDEPEVLNLNWHSIEE